MKIRTMAAVFAAKSAGFICRKMGRQGVTWAGKIALKINPDILEDLSSQVRKKIFVTCGTNGKTTTNNMLCAALENEGQKVVCNHTGSNMLNGVVAAFVLAAGPTGRLDADYACIEVDEASTRHVFPGLKPDYMLLTNLFRDQLDRYGEIDITMNILEEMIRTVPKMQVIVNADDALSAYLAMDSGKPYITYGISKPVQKSGMRRFFELLRFCDSPCAGRKSMLHYHGSAKEAMCRGGEKGNQDRGAEPQGVPRLFCRRPLRGGHRAQGHGGQVHPRRHAQPERQLCHRQKRRGERAVDAHFALRQGQYLQP